MGDKLGGSFKKPRSSLGRRNQRPSLTGHNDSRLGTISESNCPTPSTSRTNTTISCDDTLPLNYDPLCYDQFRTPQASRFASGDHMRTPKFTSQLRYYSGNSESSKKGIPVALSRQGPKDVKSVSLQTTKALDNMATPPHVLRQRVNRVSSLYQDLSEEYKQLREFSTLEKQVLSNEVPDEETSVLKGQLLLMREERDDLQRKLDAALAACANLSDEQETQTLKEQLMSVSEELKELKEKQSVSESTDELKSLREENEELRKQIETITNECHDLRESLSTSPDVKNLEDIHIQNQNLKSKCEELTVSFNEIKCNLDLLTSENKTLQKKLELTNNKLIDLETVSESKEAKWVLREAELSKSLQEAWDLLSNAGIKKDDTTEPVVNDSTSSANEFRLLKDALNKKVNAITSLQHKISVLETSFVSNIDSKNVVINALTDKVKVMSDQFNFWSNKVKKIEGELKIKNDELADLMVKYESFKTNSVRHLTKLKDDLIQLNHDECCGKMFVDASNTLEKILSGEISCDSIIEFLSSKLIYLAQDLVSIKTHTLPNADIENMKLKMESLLLEIQEKHSKIESLSSALSDKENKLENLIFDVEDRENKIKDVNSKLQSLSSELSDKTNKLDNLGIDLEDRDNRIKELQDKLSRFDNQSCEVKEKEHSINDLELKLLTLSSDLNDKTKKLDNISVELEEKNVQIKSLMIKCDAHDNVSSELTEKESIIKTLTCDLIEKDKQIVSLSSDVEAKQSKLQQLMDSVNNKDISIENLMKDLNEQDLKINSLNSLLQEKDSAVQTIISDLTSKNLIIENLTSDIQHRDTRLENLASTIQDKEKENSSIINRLQEYERKVEELEIDFREKDNKLLQLISELSEKDNKNQLLSTDLQILNEKIENLSLDCSEKENKIIALMQDLKQKDSEISSLTSASEEYVNQIASLTSNVTGGNNKVEKYILDLQEKESYIKKITSDLNCKDSEINKLLLDIKDKDFKIDTLLADLNEKKEKIKDLDSSILDKDSKLGTLMMELTDKENLIEEFGKKMLEEKERHEHYNSVIASKENLLEKNSKAVKDLENQIIELSDVLVERDNTIAQLQLEINEKSTSETNYLSSQLNDKSIALSNLETKLADKEYFINNITSQLEESNSKLEMLSSELINKTSQIENINIQLACEESKVIELSIELQAKNNELDRVIGILQEKTSELECHRKETIASSVVLAKLEDDLLSVKSEKENLNKLLQVTLDELSLLKQVSSQRDAMLNFVKKELEKTFVIMENLTCAISDQEKIVMENTKSHNDIISSYKCQVDLLNDEIESLNSNITNKEQTLKKLASVICKTDVINKSYNGVVRSIENRFLELCDLVEHYKNTISSKQQVIAKNAETYTLSKKESQSDKIELEEKLSDIQNSYEELLRNTLLDIQITQDSNLSQKDALEASIKDLKLQLDLKSTELLNSKEGVSLLNEKVARLDCERKDLLDKLTSLGSSECTNFEDLYLHIQSKFEHFTDLIEHLKNVIESKDQKISQLIKELQPSCSLRDDKQPVMSSLESEILSMNKNNAVCSVGKANEFMAENFIRMCPALEAHLSSVSTINDIAAIVRNKFNELGDIKEHLKNVITSKEEQIMQINNKVSQKQILISEWENKFATVQTEFELYKSDLKSCNDILSSKINEVDYLASKNVALNDELGSVSSEYSTLKDSLKDMLNDSSLDSCHQISELLKSKLNHFEHLCEHLKNIIQSKDDKIAAIVSKVKVNSKTTGDIDESVLDLNATSDESHFPFNDEPGVNVELELKSKIACLEKELNLKTLEINSVSDSLQETIDKFNDKEVHYREQICELQEKIYNLDSEIKLKTESIDVCNNKIVLMTNSLDSLKNNLSSELLQALDALSNYENVEQVSNYRYQTLVAEMNKLEENNKRLVEVIDMNEIKTKLFFCNLQKILLNPEEPVSIFSFDEVMNIIQSKFIEYNDLKEHLRNVICSKEEMLSKIRKEFVDKHKLVGPSLEESESSSLHCSGDVSVLDSAPELCDHIVFFNKLAELVSLFSLDPVVVDNSNYEDRFSALKSKFSELFDLVEHLRNVIKSKEDKILRLKSKLSDFTDSEIIVKPFATTERNSVDIADDDAVSQEIIDLNIQSNLARISELESLIKSKNDEIIHVQQLLSECRCFDLTEQQNVFFNDVSELLRNLGIEVSSFDCYENLTECLKIHFNKLTDLIEHLRNIIKSREDQIKHLTCNVENLKSDKKCCYSEIEEFKTLLDKINIEIEGHKKKEEIAKKCIKSLQDQIKNNNEEFSKQISVLKDLKEHTENKMQSKTQQLAKLSDDFNVFKEKAKDQTDQMSLLLSSKTEEISALKQSDVKISHKVSLMENQISELERDVATKDLEYSDIKNQLNTITSKFNELLDEKNKHQNLATLENELSSVYKELDLYKTNELLKDATIGELQSKLLELDNSISSKNKEINACKDSMDHLSQNIVELMKDRETFFTCLMSTGFIDSVKNYGDVLEAFTFCHSELNDLKKGVELLKENQMRCESLEQELDLLKTKEANHRTCDSELSDEDIVTLDNIISQISDLAEDQLKSSNIGSKLTCINDFFAKLKTAIESLQNDLELQINSNLINAEFIDKMNLEISERIEVITQRMNDLANELNSSGEHFNAALSEKCFNVENIYLEIKNTLSGFEEFMSVHDKLNEDFSYLADAYLNLQNKNDLLIEEHYLTTKRDSESAEEILNEYASINDELMGVTCNLLNNQRFDDILSFPVMDQIALDFFEQTSNSQDVLHEALLDLIISFKQETCSEDLPSCLEEIKETLSFTEAVTVVPGEILIDLDFESILSNLFKMLELVDSASVESKITSYIHNSLVKLIKADNALDISRESFNNSKDITVLNKDENKETDLSLLMGVDHTMYELQTGLNSPAGSLNRTQTSTCTLTPNRTYYNQEACNTPDSQIEQTLYLPGTSEPLSAVDPLKPSDVTIATHNAGQWMNFCRLNPSLDESGGEFHDAQESVAEVNPLSVSRFETTDNGNSNPLSVDLLFELETLFGSNNYSDIIDQIKNMHSVIEKLKSNVALQFPHLFSDNLDVVLSCIFNEISDLKNNEITFKDKIALIKSCTQSCQQSIKQIKADSRTTLSQVNLLQDQFSQDIKTISECFNKSILQMHSKIQDSNELKNKYENLGISYNDCLNKIKALEASYNQLEIELEDSKSQLSSKTKECNGIFSERIALEAEFNTVKSDYAKIKDFIPTLEYQLELKDSQNKDLLNVVSKLKSETSIMESAFNSKISQLESEKVSLSSELDALKLQIDSFNSGEDLKLELEAKTLKLKKAESTYNLLRANYDDLLKECIDYQNKLKETEKKIKDTSIFNVNEVIEELRKLLKLLDCNDEFELQDGLAPIFTKINRRIDLLKEHLSLKSAGASDDEVRNLNSRIRSLEKDVREGNEIKYNFSKELQSLKRDLDLKSLLDMPLGELYTMMINEIMAKEQILISNLKEEHDRQIVLLKDQIYQLQNEDKRRAERVSEIENDNEQLYLTSKKLKEDIETANKKLENRIKCDKLIMRELNNFEKKLMNEPYDSSKSTFDDFEEIIKQTDGSGEIITKLNKMIKGFVPSNESSVYVESYKETLKALEERCQHLEGEISLVTADKLTSDKENELFKYNMNEKITAFEKEIVDLNCKLKDSEHNLQDTKDKLKDSELRLECTLGKLKCAQESHAREQEHLQREKAFSLQALEENELFKSQLEKYLENLEKMGAELSEAKETIQSQISKHEEEISSLMKVISGLECELESTRNTQQEKGEIECRLLEVNKHFSDFKIKCDSRISSLEIENKTLKNEINTKQREISLLNEEHHHEISKLKSLLTENMDAGKEKCEALNEKYRETICRLESEMCEKEALYRDSISSFMLEKEKHDEQVRTFEEFAIEKRRIIAELENKVAEQENAYKILKHSCDSKIHEYLKQMAALERHNEELNSRICTIELSVGEKEKSYMDEINRLSLELNKCRDTISEMSTKDHLSYSNFLSSLLKLFPSFSECTPELICHIEAKIAEVESLKEELEEKQEEIKYLENDSDEIIKQVKELEKRVGEIGRSEYESGEKYKAQLEEKSLIIHKLEQQMSAHAAKLFALSEENKLKSKSINDLKTINSDLEKRIHENSAQTLQMKEEYQAMKRQLSLPPADCAECKNLKDQVTQFRAKLHLKEVKISELSSKAESVTSPLKERNSLLEKYKEKVSELEFENNKLKSKTTDESKQSSNNHEHKIQKLESRIAKLEKDREFLKKLCDKRGAQIQSLKGGHDPNK